MHIICFVYPMHLKQEHIHEFSIFKHLNTFVTNKFASKPGVAEISILQVEYYTILIISLVEDFIVVIDMTSFEIGESSPNPQKLMGTWPI